jgi:AhpD family alkylhydroperoxidase
MGAVRTGLSLNAKLRELAICAVAVINRADYELVQHAPELLAAGGTQAQLERLQDMDAAAVDATLFDAVERAVLAFTIEMTRKVQVSDACFAQLRLALPKVQEQVELAGVIAAYNMVSRVLEALHVPSEPV